MFCFFVGMFHECLLGLSICDFFKLQHFYVWFCLDDLSVYENWVLKSPVVLLKCFSEFICPPSCMCKKEEDLFRMAFFKLLK